MVTSAGSFVVLIFRIRCLRFDVVSPHTRAGYLPRDTLHVNNFHPDYTLAREVCFHRSVVVAYGRAVVVPSFVSE